MKGITFPTLLVLVFIPAISLSPVSADDIHLRRSPISTGLHDLHAPAKAAQLAQVNSRQSSIVLLNEGFEGGLVPPAGWSEVVTNHSYHWDIPTAGLPHSGNYFANVDYDDKPQDEWLLSPAMSLTQGTLSFWSFGSLYWCRDVYDYCDLKIWIVVGAPGGGDDIYLGKADADWPADWTWGQSTFNLAASLPGGPVRVGFEYFGNNGAQIALDDIRLDIPDSNPVPTTTSLNPSSVTAGGAAFSLAVNGTNFISGSSVRWNGSNRTTTYISGTQLTAAITAADIAAVGTASVTVFNGAPGGGSSNAQTFTISASNPIPTTTGLNPGSATAGGAAFSLAVNGTNFVSGSSVRWNGSNRATTYISGTQLTAAITAADIATVGTASVTVFNGAPGGGTSNPQTFTISSNNPVPTTTGLSPNSALAGGAAFTLTVNGSTFVSVSSVRWNGSNRATTYVNSTRLTAAISAADIAASGTASVTVFNGTPGGGSSNSQIFTINNYRVYLPLIQNKTGTLCNGDFEQGAACWTRYSSNGWNLIVNSDWPVAITPHSGGWLAWLGGDANEISYLQQQVTVPVGSSTLAYYHWIDSPDACGNDYGKVIVNTTTTVDVYDLCSSQNTAGWVKHVVNLGGYAGQSILLRIQAETNSSLNSHLFLDDVTFQAGSTAGQAGKTH